MTICASGHGCLFGLEGKVAVVTGGTRGIGAQMAIAMMDYGATVVPVGRTEETIESFRQRLGERGRDIFSLPTEVTDELSLTELRDAALEKHGRVDILITCAGVQINKPFMEYTEEDWDYVIDVNLKGVFLTCKVFAKPMIEQRGGKIINIGSVASFQGFPNAMPYTAAKGGIVTMTRALAVELAPYDIQVNVIAPGFFKTDLNREMLEKGGREKVAKALTPLGRLGKLEELSGACVFLASDASNYVTSHTLVVDGGLTSTGQALPKHEEG